MAAEEKALHHPPAPGAGETVVEDYGKKVEGQ